MTRMNADFRGDNTDFICDDPRTKSACRQACGQLFVSWSLSGLIHRTTRLTVIVDDTRPGGMIPVDLTNVFQTTTVQAWGNRRTILKNRPFLPRACRVVRLILR